MDVHALCLLAYAGHVTSHLKYRLVRVDHVFLDKLANGGCRPEAWDVVDFRIASDWNLGLASV